MTNMRFISQCGSHWIVRVTHTDQKNFRLEQKDEAIAHRDKMCELVGIDLDGPVRRHSEKNHGDKAYPWLPPGICLTDESVHGSVTLRSYDSRTKKSISRAYGGKKPRRTRNEALREIIEWRKERGYFLPLSWEYPDED